jgi:hypothetical protein
MSRSQDDGDGDISGSSAEEPAPAANASDHTMMMLQCLFSMVFAASVVGLLNGLGLLSNSICCPVEEGFSTCEIWKDLRSAISFLFGARLCCLVRGERSREHAAEGKVEVKLNTCLL